MALLPRRYVDSVVAIGRPIDDDKTAWRASGFLYGHCIEKGPLEIGVLAAPYVVTNKHVVKGEAAMRVRINTAEGRPIDVTVTAGGDWPRCHPTVDLAAFPMPTTLLPEEEWRSRIFLSDRDVVTREVADEWGLADGDGCFLMGFFPVWLIKEGQQAYPVTRHGTVARIQDYLDGRADTILIDAMNFPGNSGGPVVVRPEILSIPGTKRPPGAALLGVIAAYVCYQKEAYTLDQLGQEQPEPRVIFKENSGLAQMVPAATLAEWVGQFPESKSPDRSAWIERPPSPASTE